MKVSFPALRGRAAELVLTAGALTLLLALPAAAQEAPVVSLRMSGELTPGLAPRSEAAAPARSTLATKPTTKDYRIGAEDLIEIQVFGVDQLTRTVRVNSRGAISLPLVGTLQVGGLTSNEAEALIVAKLAERYLQDPQVTLFIKEFTTQRVTVEGAVNKPGVYPLRGTSSLLQTIALAGGQAGLSDMNEVMLFRTGAQGKRETLVYDVERIRQGELDDPPVLNEDVIVVKRSPSRVFMKDSIVSDFFEWINPLR
jgi:polysaccharide export outer membrane protein